MEPKRRLLEVVDRACRFKSGQNQPDFFDHVGGELATIVVLEQALQALVFEAFNHEAL